MMSGDAAQQSEIEGYRAWLTDVSPMAIVYPFDKIREHQEAVIEAGPPGLGCPPPAPVTIAAKCPMREAETSSSGLKTYAMALALPDGVKTLEDVQSDDIPLYLEAFAYAEHRLVERLGKSAVDRKLVFHQQPDGLLTVGIVLGFEQDGAAHA